MRPRIKMLLVGLNFGQWVMENEILGGAGKDYVEIVAVCDWNTAKADALAQAWGARAEHDFAAALRREDVEAVLLITGPVGRAALVEQCIDVGKPVITTKPFDPSASETLRVLRKAQDRGIPVYANSPYPTLPPEIAQMRAWMHEHDLGKPTGYAASTYCSYREKPDGSWYDDPAKCPAAPLYRLGIYLINDLCRLLPPVEAVGLLQSRLFTQRPTADNAQLSLRHEGGALGSLYCSFCVGDRQVYRNSLELHFENGSIYKHVGPIDPRESEGIVLKLALPQGEGVAIHEAVVAKPPAGYPWAEFYQAVRGEPLTETISPEQVAAAIAVIEKMSALCAHASPM